MYMETTDGVEEEIRLTSFVDNAMTDVSDPEMEFNRARHRERTAILERVECHQRTIEVLENTLSDLHNELAAEVREVTQREIQKQIQLRIQEEIHLRRIDERDLNMRARLDAIVAQGDVPKENVHGIGSRMRCLGELLTSRSYESVILFVQWKSMMRGIRSYLRSLGLRVLALDGNGRQRETTLHEFTRHGVLVLCMEDSFAGLHLPHARTVVFAHAIVGDAETVKRLEFQAIARCLRRGQTSDVDVFSFVVSESDEETLWRDTHC
jgi:SNF2 family DNA or RNA helicase